MFSTTFCFQQHFAEFSTIFFCCYSGQTIPYVEYTDDEKKCWGIVYNTLVKLYEKHACTEYMTNFRILEREAGWSPEAIPQLEDVSNFLQRKSVLIIQSLLKITVLL